MVGSGLYRELGLVEAVGAVDRVEVVEAVGASGSDGAIETLVEV
jgi:hypothetical protein